jgi:hypothetical protein
MTIDKLNELNAIKDAIQKMTEDIDRIDDFDNYHKVQIIGRINGETLDQADVLIDLNDYPELMKIIKEYVEQERLLAIKDFEEA